MPGNEVEGRVQNFLDQDINISESNRHPKHLNRNWSRFRDDSWMGNKRHSVTPLSSNQKNFSLLQSVEESKRTVGNQFLNLSPGSDYDQLTVRPEYFKSHSFLNLNSYVREHQVFIERNNEENFMGIDTEPEKSCLTPGNMLPLGLQPLKSNEHNPNFSNLDFCGSPCNVGVSHQQMSGLLGGNHPAFGDTHVLQHQAMLKYMQENRGQFNQMDARQPGSLNEFSLEKQASSDFINNTPIHTIPGFELTPELVTDHFNWMQRCTTPGFPGSSDNRSIPSADQRHAMGMMGMVSLHPDKSVYPVSVSTGGGSFKQNPHTQDPAALSTNDVQGKLLFENAPMQDLLNGALLENLSRPTPSQSSMIFNDFNNNKPVPPFSETSLGAMLGSRPSPPMLDPAEKKILFGTDDNIWSAFSDSVNETLSVRTGSWSALMQSAVGETCSGNISTPEGLSGFSSHDIAPRGITTSGEVCNSGRQSKLWEDDFNRRSSICSKPWPDHTNVIACNDNDFANPSGLSVLREHGKLHANVFGTVLAKPCDDLFEPTQVEKSPFEINSGNDHMSNTGLKANMMSGSWNCQQNVSNCSISDRPNKQSGWKPVETMGISSATVLTSQEDTDFHRFAKFNHNNTSQEEENYYGFVDNHRSCKDVEIPPSNREYSAMKNASLANDYSVQNIKDAVHPFPEFHHVDGQNYKHKGIADIGSNRQYNASNVPCFLETSTSKGRIEVNQMRDGNDKHEHSSDSFHSSSSHNASTAGLKETVWLNAADSLVTSREKQFDSSVSHKMTPHYNLIENVDMVLDPSYKSKSIVHTQTMHEKVSQILSAPEPSEFPRSVGECFEENVKGKLTKLHRDKNEVIPTRIHTGGTVNSSTPMERSISNYSAVNMTNSSENMLDLLHKVDQSGRYGSNVSFNSRLTEIPDADISDGSDSHLHKNRSFSQGFCLQLGPPSENMSLPNHLLSPQTPSWPINPPNTGQSGVMENLLVSKSLFRSLPIGSSQEFMISKINLPIQGIDSLPQASKSCFIYPDHRISNQYMAGIRDQGKTNQTMDSPCSPPAFGQISSVSTQMRSCPTTTGALFAHSPSEIDHGKNVSLLEDSHPSTSSNSHVGVYVENNTIIDGEKPCLVPVIPRFQRSVSSGIGNMWIDASVADSLKDASNVCTSKSHCSSETMSSTQNVDGVDDCDDGRGPCDMVECYSMDSDGDICNEEQQLKKGFWNITPSKNFNLEGSQEQALHEKHSPIDYCDSRSSADLQRGGLSLLVQTQGVNNGNDDPDVRETKRLKVTESEYVLSTDARVEDGFPGSIINKVASNLSEQENSAHDESATCKDSLLDHCIASRGILNSECIQIVPSLETEPPSVTSLQTSPIYGFAKNSIANEKFQLVAEERCSENLSTPNAEENQTHVLSSTGAPDILSPDVIPLDSEHQTIVSAIPDKRSNVALSFTPWSKEVTWDPRRFHDISVAEIDSARALNCAVEKNEDIYIVDDRQRLPKARLILSNQIMHQIIRPPLLQFISTDTWSDYESVVYMVSRSVLGDACCLSDCPSNIRNAPLFNDVNVDPSKTEKVSEHSLSDAVEDIICRTKKVQDELFRLEKSGGTMVEVGVEWEDMDRFSVINRFARFHGRSQGEGTQQQQQHQPSICQKTFLHRYVTALPSTPACIPDDEQRLIPL